MPLRFTVLASGSGGNACLLERDGFGLLLDAGLGPRQLAYRLAAIGASWSRVHAVLLTHTHSDHWRNPTLAHLARQRIPLYCHAGHHGCLRAYGPAFARLAEAGLVRGYEAGEGLALAPGLVCRPFPVRHDGGATFGFRFEAGQGLFDRPCALAYAADLGSWDEGLATELADVELLALEFNHDVALEHASGRSPYLIARVLGDHGHLSNAQAGALLEEVVRRSAPGRLRQVVQLHLSRECNHPELAAAAARPVLADFVPAVGLHTAGQDAPGPTFVVGGTAENRTPSSGRPRPRAAGRYRSSAQAQPWLPGLES